MSEMVERVARGIIAHKCATGFKDMIFGGGAADFDLLAPPVQEHYREEARAAIAAMREPTRAMDDAGHKAAAKAEDFGSDTGLHETICETVFKAMIDQALK